MANSGDSLGELGLDIRNFDKNASAAMQQISKMETTVQKANVALKELEKRFAASGGASKILERAVINQRVVVSSLSQQLQGLKTRQKELGEEPEERGFLGWLSSVRTGIGLLRFALLGTFAYGTKAIAEFGKELTDSAMVADLTTQSYQGIKNALMQFVSDSDADQFIQRIAAALREAKNENVEVQEAFAQLGVSIDDIRNKKPDEIGFQIATAYQQAGDKTDYMQRMSALLGDELTRRMIPALEKGGNALDDYARKATKASDANLSYSRKGILAWGRFWSETKTMATNAAGAIGQFLLGEGEEEPLSPFDVNKNPRFSKPVQKAADERSLKDYRDAKEQELQNQAEREAQEVSEKATPVTVQPTPHAAHDDIESVKQQTSATRSLRDITIGLNRAMSDRGFTLELQRKLLEAQKSALNEQLELPVVKRDQLRTSQLEAQRRELELQLDTLNYEYDRELARSRVATASLAAQQTGQGLLANIERMRAGYAERIADAQRQGKLELVEQLRAQEQLERRGVVAQIGMRTPEERHGELMQEQGFNVAVGRGESRMRELQGRQSRGIKLSRAQERELGAYQQLNKPNGNLNEMAQSFYKIAIEKLPLIEANTKEITGNAP